MSGGYSIDIRGMTSKRLDEFTHKRVPKIIEQAQISAMNKVAVTIRSRAIRGISNASRIKPMKLIRIRTGIFKANKRRIVTGIYFRHTPMPVEILASKAGVKWNRRMKGAKVKGKVYPGTFAATPTMGKHANKRQRVYKRVSKTGDPKVDLHAIYKKLDRYAPILKTTGNRVVEQKLEDLFATQFEFRVNKAIDRMNKK